jgi:anti-anti-sigma factor
LTLSGELDLANSGHLAADVEALCRRRPVRIRIDLGAVTFIDAAAVRAFVEARHRARTLGCELVLSNVHGLPLRVLRLVELDTVLLEEDPPDGT